MRLLLLALVGCFSAVGQSPADTDLVLHEHEHDPPPPMAPSEPDLEEILLTLDPTEPVPEEIVDEVLGGSASGRDPWHPPLDPLPDPVVGEAAREAVKVILTTQDPADVVAIQQEQLQQQEQRVDELAANLDAIEARLRKERGLPPIPIQEQAQVQDHDQTQELPPPSPPALAPPPQQWQQQIQYQEPPR